MGHDLTSILWIFWLFLIGLFGWACFMNWTEVQGPTFACGVISPDWEINIRASSTLQEGKSLFRGNCASCHAGDMKTHLTGPPLVDGLIAWSEYPREELYAYVRNSQEVIASGHPRANEIWEAYRPTIMNTFMNFTDEEIESILQYIAEVGEYKDRNRVQAQLETQP